MEKFKIKVCEDMPSQIAKVVEDVMPMGHIGVCFLSGDKDLAHEAMSKIKEFEYKLTYIEYPDGSVADENTIADVIGAADDIRLFVGIGNSDIAGILGEACAKRNTPYLLATYSPFLYGVGYRLNTPVSPIQVFVDNSVYNARDDFASAIGGVIAHRVGLWEKKYVYQMLGKYDYANLKREEEILDGIIGDGEMADKAKIFEGTLEYADAYSDNFISSVDILADLIERCLLTKSRGESLLISSVAILKYFEAIMSVEDARLLIPADISTYCITLSKMSGMDISEIMKCVKDRNFQSKWLYIHSEYREDMLIELKSLDSKLLKIIKSAKRFMSDVGYHLSEDYDGGIILDLLYNLSPLTHECSPISMAAYLGITNKEGANFN